MENKEWFSSWFNTKYYHLLYNNRDFKEAEFFIQNLISQLKPKAGDKILDLACGKGRHSIFLANQAYKVLGVDLSEESIAYASQFKTENLDFQICDMRYLTYQNEFDYVFNLFTSFGYFDHKEDELKVLMGVFNSLKSNGILVIDYLNVDFVKTTMIANEVIWREDVKFDISRRIENGFIYKKIEVTDKDFNQTFEEKVRAISLQDFNELAHHSGFEVLQVYGNYNLEKFSIELPRLILVAQKRNS
jgi:SAM-dependent methyltransferase